MSCVYKGSVIETTLSQNSRGGTEQMRDRLVKYANNELLDKVAVHFSRPRNLYDDVPNILYLHDLFSDPENKVLENGGWKKYDCFVFVSSWQRDQYITAFNIPYSKCFVIPNAIELEHTPIEKQQDKINFIYHTTPHRGLELVYPIIDTLSKQYDNIHLDVYSSFDIYGWAQRDKPYEGLFNKIKEHSHMTYHGAKSNSEVLAALKEAHVFIYPSIWQETSCIAMIEAIRSGCLCIHPNYGALPETASGVTAMYDYSENPNENANRCYNLTKSYLDLHKDFSYIFNLTSMDKRCALPKNSIENFTIFWNNLLKGILNER